MLVITDNGSGMDGSNLGGFNHHSLYGEDE